jgi:hypothetical protein
MSTGSSVYASLNEAFSTGEDVSMCAGCAQEIKVTATECPYCNQRCGKPTNYHLFESGDWGMSWKGTAVSLTEAQTKLRVLATRNPQNEFHAFDTQRGSTIFHLEPTGGDLVALTLKIPA